MWYWKFIHYVCTYRVSSGTNISCISVLSWSPINTTASFLPLQMMWQKITGNSRCFYTLAFVPFSPFIPLSPIIPGSPVGPTVPYGKETDTKLKKKSSSLYIHWVHVPQGHQQVLGYHSFHPVPTFNSGVIC